MNRNGSQLGRLQRVELRDVWTDEAKSFTPWLALPENVALLGEAIGMELEVEAQEKDVGPFRADILCRDTATNDWVLIENQLERTDHTHLGQLLTYAAGLKAVTIVWLASRFTDEHRAALDWLNEVTGEKFQFFGLEVEAWRIGDSPIAPKFNVVSKPNDWSREVSGNAARLASELTPTQLLQLEFWKGFKGHADAHAIHFKATKPLPQHWMSIALGRGGVHLSAVFSSWSNVRQSYDAGELRAGLVIEHPLGGSIYSQLRSRREEIEKGLGFGLEWAEKEGVKNRRITVSREVIVTDRSSWPDYFQWLVEHLDRMHSIFRPLLSRMNLNSEGDSG